MKAAIFTKCLRAFSMGSAYAHVQSVMQATLHCTMSDFICLAQLSFHHTAMDIIRSLQDRTGSNVGGNTDRNTDSITDSIHASSNCGGCNGGSESTGRGTSNIHRAQWTPRSVGMNKGHLTIVAQVYRLRFTLYDTHIHILRSNSRTSVEYPRARSTSGRVRIATGHSPLCVYSPGRGKRSFNLTYGRPSNVTAPPPSILSSCTSANTYIIRRR